MAYQSNVIHLKEKFGLFNEHWSPKNIAVCNKQLVKIAKVKGDFIWHKHANEDELFFVVKGTLYIDLKNGEVLKLAEGDMTVIPKGLEHRPRTDGSECWIMMVEPPETLNTGDQRNERTRHDIEWI